METIRNGIWRLSSSPKSHCYLAQAEGTCVLIDTGYPNCGRRIEEEIRLGLGQLDHILITHHDVDHVGGAVRLQKAFGAPIYVHTLDQPYFDGARKVPERKRAGDALLRVVTGKPQRLLSMEEMDIPGFEWFPAPGHTPGHTVFRFQRVIFSGDLFSNVGRPENMWKYHGDVDRAGRSLIAAAQMEGDLFCPAHGEPLEASPEAREELRRLGYELRAAAALNTPKG